MFRSIQRIALVLALMLPSAATVVASSPAASASPGDLVQATLDPGSCYYRSDVRVTAKESSGGHVAVTFHYSGSYTLFWVRIDGVGEGGVPSTGSQRSVTIDGFSASSTYGVLTLAGNPESGNVDDCTMSLVLGGPQSPADAGGYVSLLPSRVLDSRSALGATGPVKANGTVHLQVAGRGGVPASGVGAVVLNVTVTKPTGSSGNITVYPDGATLPSVSNLNFVKGQTVPNLVIVKVGANGKVALHNASPGTVHLIADVAGYYVGGTTTAAGSYTPLTPSRVLDSRSALGATGPVKANGTVHLQVAGRGGVPASGVGAVVLNVTVTKPTGSSGNITVYPDGATLPSVSNLNFVKGQTVPNLVIVKVGANGKVALHNASPGTVHLIADVAGYYVGGTTTAAGSYTPLTPSRVLDSRSALGATGPVKANGTLQLQVAGRGGVPASGVGAVVLNVTVTKPTGSSGNITVYPDGATLPSVSNLNFVKGQTVPNLVIVKIGANGKVALHNASPGTVHLIADVAGYYRPS